MTRAKEFKDTIKKFREPFDYSISYIGGGREVYSIHSSELKQLLFAENLRGDILSVEAECKVEVNGESIKKSVSIVGNQNKNLENNQIISSDSLTPKRGEFAFSANSLPVQQSSGSLTHAVGLPNNLNQLTQQIPMYDNQGNQIVGRENIIREVERRRAEEARKESGRQISRSFSNNVPLTHAVGLPNNLNQLTQQIPMYDNQGNQIVGRENIIREVERRRAERAEEEKSGRVQDNSVRQENYQDDGDTFYYEYFEVSK